jgi:hypothetical protein
MQTKHNECPERENLTLTHACVNTMNDQEGKV